MEGSIGADNCEELCYVCINEALQWSNRNVDVQTIYPTDSALILLVSINFLYLRCAVMCTSLFEDSPI